LPGKAFVRLERENYSALSFNGILIDMVSIYQIWSNVTLN
jgi:hypothetical protein